MKEQYFKYTTLSFLLINIWLLFALFYYWIVNPKILDYLDAGIYFYLSVFIAIGLGVLLILLRVTYARKNKRISIKNNFFYIFLGIFNLNLLIIWTVIIIFKVLPFNRYTIPFLISNLLVATFVFVDIYLYKIKKNNNIPAEKE